MQYRNDSKETTRDYALSATGSDRLDTVKSWITSSHYGKAGLRAIQIVNGYARYTTAKKQPQRPVYGRLGAGGRAG